MKEAFLSTAVRVAVMIQLFAIATVLPKRNSHYGQSVINIGRQVLDPPND